MTAPKEGRELDAVDHLRLRARRTCAESPLGIPFLMARITVEDCLQESSSRFELVMLAVKRARQLLKGAKPLIGSDNREIVIAFGRSPQARYGGLLPRPDMSKQFLWCLNISCRNWLSFYSFMLASSNFSALATPMLSAEYSINL